MITTNERLEIYREAIKQWGVDAQIDMAIEEMAELISALQHHRRREERQHIATINEVIDEIADVEIMMEQLKYMFFVNSLFLSNLKEKKLVRVKKLLNMT